MESLGPIVHYDAGIPTGLIAIGLIVILAIGAGIVFLIILAVILLKRRRKNKKKNV